jgi:hypothetical protein
MFAANTMFYRNVNAINGVILTGDGRSKMLVDMYARLATVSRTINVLMQEYSKGNFYEVANTLTNEVFNKLSMRLGALAADPVKYPDYEVIRAMTTCGLSGMYQGLLQYANLVETDLKLKICQEHESILHDPAKLQEWINHLRQRRTLFPESKVQVRKATLKPEYAEYIKQHGFPEGGVFDPNKLNAILNKLGIYYT